MRTAASAAAAAEGIDEGGDGFPGGCGAHRSAHHSVPGDGGGEHHSVPVGGGARLSVPGGKEHISVFRGVGEHISVP